VWIKPNQKISYNSLLSLIETQKDPLIIDDTQKIIALRNVDSVIIDRENGIVLIRQDGTKITLKLDDDDYLLEVNLESE
jgi:hypothetical protein